tara:strand:- start:2673 stop:5144 length:2472 start_codon:yes stop_codon:yes gene_type:complete
MQDVYLTGNSQVTFFKNLYRRHTNFSVEAVQQTFQSSSRAFGNRLVSVVSRNGDLLHRVWLEVSLRAQTADVTYVNNLCHALVKSAEVEIGGQRIDRVYGRFSHLWHKLTCRAGKEFGFDVMAGCGGVPGDADSPQAAPSFATSRKVFIPIDFFFSKGRVGSALPLIALQYHEVRITIELADKDEILRAVQEAYPKLTDEQSQTLSGAAGSAVDQVEDAHNADLLEIVATLKAIVDGDTFTTTLDNITDIDLNQPQTVENLNTYTLNMYRDVIVYKNKIKFLEDSVGDFVETGGTTFPDITDAENKIKSVIEKLADATFDTATDEELLNEIKGFRTNLEKFTGSAEDRFDNIDNALKYLSGAKLSYEKLLKKHNSSIGSVSPSFSSPTPTPPLELITAEKILYGLKDDNGDYTGVYLDEDGITEKTSLQKIYDDLKTTYPEHLYSKTDEQILKVKIQEAKSMLSERTTKTAALKTLSDKLKKLANSDTDATDLENSDFDNTDITPELTISSEVGFASLMLEAHFKMLIILYEGLALQDKASKLKNAAVAVSSDISDLINDINGQMTTINDGIKLLERNYQAVKHLLVTGYFVGGYSSAAGRESFDDIVDFEEQPRLFTDFFFLDTEERRRFSQMSHEYLIEQLQFLGTEVTPKLSQGSEVPFSMELDFNHPTKALYWTTEVSDGNKARRNPFYNGLSETEPNTLECRSHQGIYDNCPVASVSLNLNGYDRFSPRDGEYFWLCQPYQHHRRVPHDHWLGMYSFCLKPEEHQPSGTLNFSRIDAARLTMHFKSHASECRRDVYVYALNYNVLRILSGMGGLAFSN